MRRSDDTQHGVRRQRTGAEEIAGGLTGIGVMAVLFFTMPGSWWALIVAAFCMSRVVRGIQKVAANRRLAVTAAAPRLSKDAAAKQVLRVAQQMKGIVTPSLVTLNSSLGLEEAERLLQEMSAKGYASMNVTDSGRIEYEFAEFLDPVEHPKGGAAP